MCIQLRLNTVFLIVLFLCTVSRPCWFCSFFISEGETLCVYVTFLSLSVFFFYSWLPISDLPPPWNCLAVNSILLNLCYMCAEPGSRGASELHEKTPPHLLDQTRTQQLDPSRLPFFFFFFLTVYLLHRSSVSRFTVELKTWEKCFLHIISSRFRPRFLSIESQRCTSDRVSFLLSAILGERAGGPLWQRGQSDLWPEQGEFQKSEGIRKHLKTLVCFSPSQHVCPTAGRRGRRDVQVEREMAKDSRLEPRGFASRRNANMTNAG